MADFYQFYRADLSRPGLLSRDTTDAVDGFYRSAGARTKIDWPIAIWHDADVECVKIGRKVLEGEALASFRTEATWLGCAAVTKDVYDRAIETGFWPDGKTARNMDDAEKLDIIPTTPADEGGNMVGEDGKPIDQFWLQIKTKMDAALAGMAALGKIDSQDKAEKLAGFLDTMTAAGKLGEGRRVEEKLPWDTGANAVQAKWVPVLRPASDAIKAGKDAIEAFKRAERARLQKIEDDRIDAEREATRKKNAEIEEANRLAAKEAADKGVEPAPVAELIPEPEAVQVEAPRVSSAYGRAVTKAVVRKGRILDEAKFIKAIKGGEDFKEFLQTKANALARAKTVVAGMEIVTE